MIDPPRAAVSWGLIPPILLSASAPLMFAFRGSSPLQTAAAYGMLVAAYSAAYLFVGYGASGGLASMADIVGEMITDSDNTTAELITRELIARYREEPLLALQTLPGDPLGRTYKVGVRKKF